MSDWIEHDGGPQPVDGVVWLRTRKSEYCPVKKSNDLSLDASVVEVEDCPGEWLVEAIDHGSEGEIYRTIFAGPMAEQRARAYALLVYRTQP